MKKMMAMVLAALLMMAFLPAGAEGAQAEFTSTQSLLDALDADGIDYYEYNGIYIHTITVIRFLTSI